MISPNEIKNKAERKYFNYLQDVVTGIPYSKIIITGNKKPSGNLSQFNYELTELMKSSKEKKGYGYTVKYETIKKKTLGTQDVPSEICFETETDFLKFLQKEKEVKKFHENCALIISQFSELKEWIINNPKKIINNQNQWNDLLKVCQYFKSNPHPDLFIRELPIQVHTKFIENNKTIIRELLDVIIGDHIQQDERDFEQRFNLKYPESLVRFRILDKNISATFFSGIDDLSISINQFEQLKLPIQNVLIVENKTNLHTIALTIPLLEKTIVVFGSGYKVEKLKGVEWFNRVKLFYWGDLDVHGFEILSQFRGYFSNVKSILMDKGTFDKFYENDKGVETKTKIDLNLNGEEQELYNLLKHNNARLEQEKIPQEYVKEKLYNLL